ncbi:MAG: hypothetical protein FD144_5966, partial [Rhodospirillaceae bacterium]
GDPFGQVFDEKQVKYLRKVMEVLEKRVAIGKGVHDVVLSVHVHGVPRRVFAVAADKPRLLLPRTMEALQYLSTKIAAGRYSVQQLVHRHSTQGYYRPMEWLSTRLDPSQFVYYGKIEKFEYVPSSQVILLETRGIRAMCVVFQLLWTAIDEFALPPPRVSAPVVGGDPTVFLAMAREVEQHGVTAAQVLRAISVSEAGMGPEDWEKVEANTTAVDPRWTGKNQCASSESRIDRVQIHISGRLCEVRGTEGVVEMVFWEEMDGRAAPLTMLARAALQEEELRKKTDDCVVDCINARHGVAVTTVFAEEELKAVQFKASEPSCVVRPEATAATGFDLWSVADNVAPVR